MDKLCWLNNITFNNKNLYKEPNHYCN